MIDYVKYGIMALFTILVIFSTTKFLIFLAGAVACLVAQWVYGWSVNYIIKYFYMEDDD